MAKKFSFIVAMDIGTTFSGWAFSSCDDHRKDPAKVYCKAWNNTTGQTMKTPTCILISPDGETVKAFGYDAQEEYLNLWLEGATNASNYFYFENFKTALYKDENKPPAPLLSTVNGEKTLPSEKVFSLAVRCLKEDAEKELRKIHGGQDVSNAIHWVLTVPAICTDSEKSFMRTAAKKAGIEDGNLTIALEPEAASVYCNHVPVVCSESSTQLTSFKPGQQYILVDAGGGTVDISVHEVLKDGNLRELHQANGGSWGGVKVQEAFSCFLVKIFGSDKIMAFKENAFDDYAKLFQDFEMKKKKIRPESDAFQVFTLTADAIDHIAGSPEGVEKNIQRSVHSEKVKLLGKSKLRISDTAMKEFFENATASVVEHLVSKLHRYCTSNTIMVLVGGFSESEMLRAAITQAFPEMKVYVPQESGLAVLKGAVIFGHKPFFIQERISRYTYGYELVEPFQKDKHVSFQKTYDGTELLAKKNFIKLVQRDEPVQFDKCVYKGDHYPFNGAKIMVFVLYASKDADPKVVTDESCMPVGEMTVEIENTRIPPDQQRFEVQIYTGGTEIKVRYKECSTGKVTEKSFDYLKL